MVLYKKLGYNSIEEYQKDFINELLVTNHNFDYFVNWEKVYSNVKTNLTEISILNSLNKIPKEEIENQFKTIIATYPEVVPILPSILAIRTKKDNKNIIEIFDGDIYKYDFNEESFNIEDITYFCKKTGLIELFNRINDLYAYLLGTEVGLDSNGRKNRSGTSFESIIEQYLTNELNNYPGYTLNAQEYVYHINRTKRSDFVISKNGVQKIIIECNFYNSTGSKPIEVANSYIDLQNQISNEDLIFIWVTDGQGWKKMAKTLYEVIPQIDYLVNYTILKRNFKKILELE